MGNRDALILLVESSSNSDEEVAEATQLLRRELLDLDVSSVEPVVEAPGPSTAKGSESLVGQLAVRLGLEGLRTVVAAVAGCATRTGHSVEVIYDGETLKVLAVASAEQERIINDYLARHT